MTYLMMIAETKKPSNSSTSIIGVKAQEIKSQTYEPVTWKGRSYENLLIHRYVLYDRLNSKERIRTIRGSEVATKRSFAKLLTIVVLNIFS